MLIGQGAPNFIATAVMPDNAIDPEFQLAEYIAGKYGVLFFYTLNHSYVCPTELIALNNRIKDFQRRNAVVVAVSVDSHLSHLQWKALPKEKGGVGALKFPMVSDITKEISKTYDVLVNQAWAIRATFLIDRKGYIRNQSIYDFSIGRNVDEILRIIDAQHYREESGSICPANWQAGDPGLECDDTRLGQYMRHYAENL